MSKKNLYIGRAGQMAVMAEFLARGYNVAIPEVDIGDDILVVKDEDGEYLRIQVKTALVTKTGAGYGSRYAIRFEQLENPSKPETWFVFANRFQEKWQSFIVISRAQLYGIYDRHHIGSLNQRNLLLLYLSYSDTTVTCSGQDLSRYLNNWDPWPYVQHDA
jgi:hypothetical protein